MTSGYGFGAEHRPYPPPKPPMLAWDLTMSVIVLVITGVVVAFGVLFGTVSVVFLDYCPPDRCSVGGVMASVGITLLLAVLVAFGGLIVTVMRIARRRISWPFAFATLVLCTLTLALGTNAYSMAAGV